MKILMILSNPFMVDPRVHDEAKTLVDAGNEVTVIVWDRHADYLPEETVEGIRVVRIYNKGMMKILPNDLFKNPLWWRRAYKKGLELYKNGFEFNVVHCHDLDTLQAGAWLKKKLKVKLIYDAHEIFGHMISRDVPKIVVKIVYSMECHLAKKVDYIITVTEPVKKYFESIGEKPVMIVMNCKNLIGEYKTPNNKIFTIVYIGTLHKRRFFPEMVDVVGKIEGVKLVLGAKKENMKIFNEVEKLSGKYKNVEFLGPVPINEVMERLVQADATLQFVEPTHPNERIGIPLKLFEAMVAGRPIIVTKGIYCTKIVKETNCGIITEYGKDGLIEAIITLRDNPALCNKLGRNALKAAEKTYSWENMKKRLLKVYKDLSIGSD